MAMPVESGSHF